MNAQEHQETPPIESCGISQEFTSGNGTVRLLVFSRGARLIITPYDSTGPVFERDYDLDQKWMAERDFQTLYHAIWG